MQRICPAEEDRLTVSGRPVTTTCPTRFLANFWDLLGIAGVSTPWPTLPFVSFIEARCDPP